MSCIYMWFQICMMAWCRVQ